MRAVQAHERLTQLQLMHPKEPERIAEGYVKEVREALGVGKSTSMARATTQLGGTSDDSIADTPDEIRAKLAALGVHVP